MGVWANCINCLSTVNIARKDADVKREFFKMRAGDGGRRDEGIPPYAHDPVSSRREASPDASGGRHGRNARTPAKTGERRDEGIPPYVVRPGLLRFAAPQAARLGIRVPGLPLQIKSDDLICLFPA